MSFSVAESQAGAEHRAPHCVRRVKVSVEAAGVRGGGGVSNESTVPLAVHTCDTLIMFEWIHSRHHRPALLLLHLLID